MHERQFGCQSKIILVTFINYNDNGYYSTTTTICIASDDDHGRGSVRLKRRGRSTSFNVKLRVALRNHLVK